MKLFIGYVVAFIIGWLVGLLILKLIHLSGHYSMAPLVVLVACGLVAQATFHAYLTHRRTPH